MIITRRQATTDAERRGGYAGERIVSDTALNAEIPSEAVSDSIIGNAQPVEDIRLREKPSVAQDFKYTTREAMVAPPAVEPKKNLPPRPEKAKRAHEKDDIMPTLKTRSVLSTPIEEDVQPIELNDAVPTKRQRTQLSPKIKVMLFVYLAIALVLAVAVIATGVSISKATAAADTLAQEIAAKQTLIANQQTDIAASTDPDAIRDEAINLGMTYAGDPAGSATTVGKVEYPDPPVHTNGFDGFCDWLTRVLM